MNWVLYVVLASSTASDKAINATPVPMATEQLCNEAKNKLFESYRRSNTPNWIMVIECLRARSAMRYLTAPRTLNICGFSPE